MMGYGYLGMAGMWLPMLIGFVLLIAVIVLAIVATIRLTSKREPSPGLPPGTDARQILATRFARGEIDTDEYRARMQALDETRS